MKKKCTKCSKVKEETCFSYRNKQKKVRRTDCKHCCSKLTRKHYLENKQDYKNRSAARRHSLSMWFYEVKSKYSCINCGEDHPICIDFHHKEGKFKTVSSMVSWMHSRTQILAEIEKCIPLCSNCHRILHSDEYTYHKQI